MKLSRHSSGISPQPFPAPGIADALADFRGDDCGTGDCGLGTADWGLETGDWKLWTGD